MYDDAWRQSLYVARATSGQSLGAAPAAVQSAVRAEALREASQPIETAPKDGTPFLAWVPTYYQGKGAWVVALMLHGIWMDNRAWKIEPVVWLPLPPVPALAAKGGGT